jgi:hypothetical protein
MSILPPRMTSRFRLLVLRQVPVIVFSAERTGTVGMLRSLEASGMPCMASHYLAPANLGTPRMSRMARWASSAIVAKRRPARFITLVRNPIDMMTSSFARAHASLFTSSDAASLETARELFHREWIESGRYRHPLEWMTKELSQALGIDPYQHPFDTAAGASELASGPFRLLILRTDLSEDAKTARINAFLNTQRFKMLTKDDVYGESARADPTRPGSTTHHGATYDALRSGALIPVEVLSEITNSPYVQHFFDPASIDAMRQRAVANEASLPHE